MADQRSASAGIATDDVDQAKAIHTKAGHVGVLHEVLALEFELVVFVPVAADGQHLGGRAVNRDHIGQCDLVLVLIAGQVVVNTHLQHLVAVVFCEAEALVLGLALFNVREERLRLTQVNIAIEASDL